MTKNEKTKLIQLKNELTQHYDECEKSIKTLFKIAKRHGLRMSIDTKITLYEILKSDKTNDEEKQDALTLFEKHQQAIGRINTINQVSRLLEVDKKWKSIHKIFLSTVA